MKYIVKCTFKSHKDNKFYSATFEINGVKKKARVRCVSLPEGHRDKSGHSSYPFVTWRLEFEDRNVRTHPDYAIIRSACIKVFRKSPPSTKSI